MFSFFRVKRLSGFLVDLKIDYGNFVYFKRYGEANRRLGFRPEKADSLLLRSPRRLQRR